MKHIKSYMNKIEEIIASKNKDQPKNEMDLIVGFVQSIRQAREEMKNG